MPSLVINYHSAGFYVLSFRGFKISGAVKVSAKPNRYGNCRGRSRLKPISTNALRRVEEEQYKHERNKTKSFLSHENFEEYPLTCKGPVSSMESLVDSSNARESRKSLILNSEPVTSLEQETTDRVIRVPGLPDENKGADIENCVWEWKPKLKVHYKRAGLQNTDSPAVLFLPGFGVGAFHYVNQLRDLGSDFRVWAVDFVGQGQSLPSEDPAPLIGNVSGSGEGSQDWGFGPLAESWADKLVFSVDLWREQILDFVEKVIGEPTYIIGNSLGGFVGLYFTACNPHLVRGITLLNATPFWAFVPNSSRSPTVSKLFPWAGNFPLPPFAKHLTNVVWKIISNPKSVENVLKQVYVDQSVVTHELLQQILGATEHPAAAAVFASILFAPQGGLSFNESLQRCQEAKIPLCLIYGREDPWVQPLWGRKVKKQVREALYYEISPAGHCPHSEVPEVVNFLLHGWIRNLESGGMLPLPLFEHSNSAPLNFWREFEFSRMGFPKLVRVRVVGDKHTIH